MRIAMHTDGMISRSAGVHGGFVEKVERQMGLKTALITPIKRHSK